MLYAIGVLCLVLSLISARSSFFPLKWLTSFAWWGLLMYWIDADLIPDGDPTDIAVMLVIVFAAMLFMLWGLAGRLGKDTAAGGWRSEVQENTQATKSRQNRSVSTMNESAEEYKARIHRKRRRRR